MSLQRLPTELKLRLLGFLELQSLASLRNTCRSWHNLIQSSLAQPHVIPSARADLLRLYLDLHKFESFKPSRKHIVPHIRPFPRQEYLDRLTCELAEEQEAEEQEAEEYKEMNWSIPEQFSTWILEWPANAIIGWVWPGLDDQFNRWAHPRGSSRFTDPNGEAHWWRAYGSNVLQWKPQGLSLGAIEVINDAFHLIVHAHGCGYITTICFDNDPKCNGTVWVGGAMDYFYGEIDLDNPNWYGHKWVKRDWVTWLREELDSIEMQYNPG